MKMCCYCNRTLIVLALLFSSLISFAQQDFSKVDKWLNKNTVDMGGRSVLMIYKDGEIIYSKTVNDMNRRQRWVNAQIAKRMGPNATVSDFDTNTRQMIASCSKWLSAALVMTFVDEGKLSTTDTVGTYLPILSQHDKGHITIGQCLSHLTGIQAPPIREELRELKNMGTMQEEIGKIAQLPMEGEPGKVFHYSNIGLQIAGAVIEKISGKSFETLFAERIARPLEMKNTDFGRGKTTLPAGGARSTPEDYMNFLQMVLNKGIYNGRRILSEESIHEMQINRVTEDVMKAYSPAEAGTFGYGYGEWVMETSTTDNISTVVSSPGLFGSFPWVDNEKQYCAFLMTFYLRNNERHSRYSELRAVVDEALNN